MAVLVKEEQCRAQGVCGTSFSPSNNRTGSPAGGRRVHPTLMIAPLLLTVSVNLRDLASEQIAQPAEEGQSLARPARSLGVDLRPAACLLEPGPLTHLFGLCFLRPADECRLAAGHGELLDV
jgi:hypothetical protein